MWCQNVAYSLCSGSCHWSIVAFFVICDVTRVWACIYNWQCSHYGGVQCEFFRQNYSCVSKRFVTQELLEQWATSWAKNDVMINLKTIITYKKTRRHVYRWPFWQFQSLLSSIFVALPNSYALSVSKKNLFAKSKTFCTTANVFLKFFCAIAHCTAANGSTDF